LQEETGLEPQALYSADICEQFYEADRDSISLLPVFVAVVAADCAVTLNHEHSGFQWLGFNAAVALEPFIKTWTSSREVRDEVRIAR
jgi:dihydroneopterin triphosphate diphosphatase